ncbi:MAG: ATP-binding cassette domain-containing protein [Gammaproteobacteria bacterium]|nr:ATP-binding cassette domain-containing protein [Gammaproteobacteria bacterium]
MSTGDLGTGRLLTRALPEFHRLALGAESLNRRLLLADEANLQVAQASQRRRAKLRARAGLARLTGGDSGTEPGDRETLLGKALEIIGKREGLEFRKPDAIGNAEPTLRDFCEASGVRARPVRLAEEDRWWLGDSGAMLAFGRADGRAVVLMPGADGRYRIVDPTTGGSIRADARSARQLQDACLLYPHLSREGAAGLGDLFRTAGAMLATDIGLLVVMGLGAGMLTLAPVVAINLLAGVVIPGGDAVGLFQLSALLTGLALVSALFHVLRGTALMRLEGRLAARLGAVVWDRLLRLRPDFFRRYSVGDLAARSMVFQDIRDHVSGVAADGVLSSLFLLPALGLLLLYDAGLGLAVAGFGVLALAATVLSGILHVEPQRRHLEVSQQLAGSVHQFLSGISKLRATGSEDSAFAAWAEKYREQKRAEIRLSALSEHIAAFSAAAPALASGLLFAVAVRHHGGLQAADFLAVHTAAMVFSLSMITLGNSVRAIALVAPACGQIRPILASPADAGSRQGNRGRLSGEILLDQVSFGYPGQSGKVLEDVTIHARPDEFVAIVGESGSGKSTVLRLALGLETPSSGAVYYDGRDLAHLDLGAVRSQIGVVMQDGFLQLGNILEAIIGVDGRLGVDDAWRAAGLAGVEEDIRAMPMGLYTAVGEDSTAFSGGQHQRIRIAAALVDSPRIILLDEPTSWLDARSQARTMQGIGNSPCTRIVIAHRLSTVRMANRIYVLRHGRVAQTGSFDELLGEDGPFRDLALRQMA